MQGCGRFKVFAFRSRLIVAILRCQNAVFKLNEVTAMQAGNVRYHDYLPAAVLHGDADVIMPLMLSLVSVSAGCVIGMRMCAMFTDFPRDGSGDDAAGHGIDGIALGDIDEINDTAIDAV